MPLRNLVWLLVVPAFVLLGLAISSSAPPPDKDYKLIRQIADLGIAVILVEHDIALVMDISDSIVVLDAGSVIAAGAPAEVRRDPRLVSSLTVSPDNKLLATGGAQQPIVIWDLEKCLAGRKVNKDVR